MEYASLLYFPYLITLQLTLYLIRDWEFCSQPKSPLYDLVLDQRHPNQIKDLNYADRNPFSTVPLASEYLYAAGIEEEKKTVS
jgi:hypothetical protein